MTKHTNLLFIFRIIITLFIFMRIFTNIQIILGILIGIFIFIFFYSIKKTRFFNHIKKIDSLINLYLSRIVLKLIWIIVYFMSIPFLKFWSVTLNKKNNQKVALNNFDFKSEYRCTIDS